jgi:plasmid stabilization system protein ParE
MKVVFDAKASEDLEHIFAWIAQDDALAAHAVVERILASVERLGEFPEMARAGRVQGTREWVVPRLPYIVVYVTDWARDELVVVGIFHGAQNR